MIQEFESLYDLLEAFPDEQSCVDHLSSIRWQDGAYCPFCGGVRVYHFSDKKNHKCGDCRRRFSIKVGSIFEDSKLPLRKWFMAIWLITSNRKGIASTQLARDIKVTQKSAWFMLHRLRHAARSQSFRRPLDGEIELDETFVGGRERNKHSHKRTGKTQGGAGKIVVFGMLQRQGELRTQRIENLRGGTIARVVGANVARGATVLTDEHPSYNSLKPHYNHHAVNHSAGEYVRQYFCHTNGIESVWALFKRQIIGVHHWISAKHIQRYLDELSFRYNRRDMEEGARVNEFLSQVNGRLTYKALIG